MKTIVVCVLVMLAGALAVCFVRVACEAVWEVAK